MDTLTIETPKCPHCHKPGTVQVTRDGWERYTKRGELVQVAFPEMPADQREQLINGTHPKCWDEMFGNL